ncbi:hypothetical protein [Streptomyces sp. NPDC017230]|uniref:hypothetical protein n=1 Tax=unclassified Streptomyces TaxID=2593676 RepID=UPI0037BC9645
MTPRALAVACTVTCAALLAALMLATRHWHPPLGRAGAKSTARRLDDCSPLGGVPVGFVKGIGLRFGEWQGSMA